ncbi:MAG: EamA family transporter [Gemmatimonadetes bacterium]|nr:EamA family transporter [Gemmatimonadota bacterium]
MIAGFAAIYLIWGSTYLAIRFAIETVPPLLMAGVRFLVAGSVLYAWSRGRGAVRPTRAQWRAAFVVGGLLLLGGNGAVVVAEQWVPSGLTALLIGAVPLWMVLVDWGWGSRVPPSRRVALGLIAGFAGLATLVGAPGAGAGGHQELLGGLVVVLGALAWATGSIYSRHAPMPPRPRLWVAMQMLAGGSLLVLAAGLAGEWGGFDPGAVSARSALALLYLVVFGSLVAYTAYIWLLSVSTPARVGTYAYVNPVVALLLGWALADEPLSFRSLLAAAIIVSSVVVTTTGGSADRRIPGSAPEAAPTARRR